MITALIDGDIVAYRSAASCNPTKAKPEQEPLEAALMRADELMSRILHETETSHYKLYIGGEDNFRYGIDPEYKANRNDTPRPIWLQDVRAYLVSQWNAEIVNGIEADDAMGLEQSANYQEAREHWDHNATVICSIDKDLLMIPGNHYNFVTCEKTFTYPIDGLRRFYQQLIQGDKSDNVMGYDGKARPKLPQFLYGDVDYIWACDNEIDMFEKVRVMYNDDERLLRNGRLLWIQQANRIEWTFPVTQQPSLEPQ